MFEHLTKSFRSSRVPLGAHHAHSSFLMSEQHASDHDQKQSPEHKFRHNQNTIFTYTNCRSRIKKNLKGYTKHINTFTAIVDLSRFNNSCLKSRQLRP